jgi:hypothetical protein
VALRFFSVKGLLLRQMDFSSLSVRQSEEEKNNEEKSE